MTVVYGYYNTQASYVNPNSHKYRVNKKGITKCVICKIKISLNPRSKLFCRTAHIHCVKLQTRATSKERATA